MEKQTNKFDTYLLFLNSLTKRHEVEKNNIEKKLGLYASVKDILEKRSCGQRIPLSSYAKLKEYDCPEQSLIHLFSKPLHPTSDGGFMLQDDDSLLFECPSLDCAQCWKNFIDNLTEAINSSDVMIKNTDFEEDEE